MGNWLNRGDRGKKQRRSNSVDESQSKSFDNNRDIVARAITDNDSDESKAKENLSTKTGLKNDVA